MAVLLYVDDGILASPWPARMQEVLDVLTEIFDRVGLRMNMEKMVGMVFQPFWTVGI